MSKNIFFWANEDEYGVFSNFWEGPFLIDGKEWLTTEHYFAAMKTLDPSMRETIREADAPIAAKMMGRGVKLRDDWEQVKYDVMLQALRVKFSDSHPEFMALLIGTGDATIYEDSPFDDIWGTGVRGGIGTGQNLLGKALMQVREELKVVKV